MRGINPKAQQWKNEIERIVEIIVFHRRCGSIHMNRRDKSDEAKKETIAQIFG